MEFMKNLRNFKIKNFNFNPYGVLLISVNKNNLIYTAREFEFDTGLQFNRNRYYNASLGRFVYKDQFKTLEVFQYASNSPLDFIDPFGESIFMTCFIGPIIPPCKGWQWASYIGCIGVCSGIASYFQSLCEDELARCIDRCPDFDADCLEGCHNNYFWCMVAVTVLYCYCSGECKSICAGDKYLDLDIGIY